jgi:hypothetical protein
MLVHFQAILTSLDDLCNQAILYMITCSPLAGTLELIYFWLGELVGTCISFFRLSRITLLTQRKGDFITWGVPIFFFFIQNGANFAQPLLWVPKTSPQRKNFKKMFLTSYLVPLKKCFFARFTLFLGVRKYFFFIQNVANFAQPLLWILRTPLFKKNHKKIFSTSYLDPLKM